MACSESRKVIEKQAPVRAGAISHSSMRPVGIFFTTDAYLGRGSWSDAGLYMQTVMLAARAFGLHTCPQAAWIQFQEPIFRHLNIPDDQVLISGLSLGYIDDTAIENTLVSEREEMSKVVKFVGFD